jgi:hypothetical protein
MPLFGFADINFNKGQQARKGPLNKLVATEFGRTTLRYPIDVGNYDKSHYVVFYIRQQKNTSFKRTKAPENAFSDVGGAKIQSSVDRVNNFGSEIQNKINSGIGQINQATGGALGGLTSTIGKATSGVTGKLNNL